MSSTENPPIRGRIDLRSAHRPFLGLPLVLAAVGCQARLGPPEGAVRQAERIQDLEAEVATLQVRLGEALATIDSVRGDDPATVPEAGAIPVPVRVVDGMGTAVRSGTIQWRLRTEDRRGRFVQTVGPATIVALGMGVDGEGIELGRWVIGREAWRESLREGFLGSAYAVDLEIGEGLPPDAQVVIGRVEIQDPRLETPIGHETSIPVIRAMEDPQARRGE